MPAGPTLDLSLGPTRTALVLFDVLQDYVHPKNPTKAAVLRERGVLERLQDLVRAAHDAGMRIFYPAANHAPDYSDVVTRLRDTDMDLNPWPEGAQPPFRPIVRRGEAGNAIAAGLEPGPNDVVVPKHRWSAFFQTALELNLRSRGIETIVLAGLSTDVGIASTAFTARDMDFGLVVVRDACWSHRPGNHDFFMDRVFPRMGRVMHTRDVTALMHPEVSL